VSSPAASRSFVPMQTAVPMLFRTRQELCQAHDVEKLVFFEPTVALNRDPARPDNAFAKAK